MTGIAKQPGYKVLPKKFFSNNVYLSGNNLNSFKWLKNISFKGKPLVEKLILKAEAYSTANRIKQGKFDVFHPTYYHPAFLTYIPKNKPFVLTVHDMIHESYFDKIHEYLSEETKHKIALIPKADHIIAVSQYVKNQILKYFPQIDEKKISVIYHGTNLQPHTAINKPSGLPEKYLLFIGLKKHYKNFFWLAESLKDYLKQHDITLLCAGGFDFDTYESDFISVIDLRQYVKHITINSDDELISLYENAECFIFPSLAEGFGIPVLEAFACGCPVILSNSSCFPEIAGDAAMYFEPGDKDDLLQKIDTIRHNKTVRNTLVEKGAERVKLFTWEKTVARHLEVYNLLLN